jgi:hypothetical protein
VRRTLQEKARELGAIVDVDTTLRLKKQEEFDAGYASGRGSPVDAGATSNAFRMAVTMP